MSDETRIVRAMWRQEDERGQYRPGRVIALLDALEDAEKFREMTEPMMARLSWLEGRAVDAEGAEAKLAEWATRARNAERRALEAEAKVERVEAILDGPYLKRTTYNLRAALEDRA